MNADFRPGEVVPEQNNSAGPIKAPRQVFYRCSYLPLVHSRPKRIMIGSCIVPLPDYSGVWPFTVPDNQ